MRKKLALFVVVLALASTAATCRTQTPRHDSTVALTAFSHAIGGLQDGVVVSCNAAIIKPDACRTAGAVFVKVWAYDADAVVVVRAWTPGQPIPAILASEIGAIRKLIDDLVLDKVLPAQVGTVYKTITDLLLLFIPGGVA